MNSVRWANDLNTWCSSKAGNSSQASLLTAAFVVTQEAKDMILPLICLVEAATKALDSRTSTVTLEVVASLQNMINLAADIPGSLVTKIESSTSNWDLCCAFLGCWLTRFVLIRLNKAGSFVVAELLQQFYVCTNHFVLMREYVSLKCCWFIFDFQDGFGMGMASI